MKWKSVSIVIVLILVLLGGLTMHMIRSRSLTRDIDNQRWEIIGEWVFQDEANQFYVNLLDIDFSKHEVMMNFAFLNHQSQTIIESREMRTYPMTWIEEKKSWLIKCTPVGYEVLICTIDEYAMMVNSKLLIRKKTIHVY